MPLSTFHPITQQWFAERFGTPTEAQARGWPAIARGLDTLIAAPTGSGKTLAAFLASIDCLLRAALAGELRDTTHVLYVSPLRALANDIQRNLEEPLAELLAIAEHEFIRVPEIRALVRTGDTPASERQQMLRKPPHILVTTPESLYLVMTGEKSREILRTVDTVIVDEIHALARDKRGAHLSLSLERLDAMCVKRPVRIGLSATQAPLDQIGRFLVGRGGAAETVAGNGSGDPASGEPSRSKNPVIVDAGHIREIDLAVETPITELGAACTHEQWAEIYERIVALVHEHRSTLIFVNTRKLAERVSFQLTQRLGEGAVMSHHGSLSHKLRRETERGLKLGTLKAVVATASLELGIDVGHIDLVVQIGTPRGIATFLQRVGRAGHSLGATPKGRLFALTRDDVVECLALVRAVRAGRLDAIEIPRAPLDVMAQQIVAAVACDEWDVDELFALCCRAYPYRDLTRKDFDEIVGILSDGIASRAGRRGAYIHYDRVGRALRPRRGARLIAITCGGAIPEVADFRVVLDDDKRTFIGTLNEDFAIEANGGDVFLLGNTSWMIKHVRGGEVVVMDAHGAPPTIPFWLGEAPGRTRELSEEVARLREEIAERVEGAVAVAASPRPAAGDAELASGAVTAGDRAAAQWLESETRATPWAAEQAVRYVAAQRASAGVVPTQRRVLFERFFDEGGGMQLVVHAPFGTRINRAWGLALRKRFCRTFNFELQASADDDGIVLSLGEGHSFPIEQMFKLVDSRTAEETLVQAVLATPFFPTRWRWDATRALALKRFEKGKRVPPQIQRMRSDDMLTSVFPQSTACLEHIVGDIEVPDHPLVREAMNDCLHEAMDLDGWIGVLHEIEAGRIELVGVDTTEPSPFSHQRLNAMPYAFLDDAPLEERRARAVTLRRTLDADSFRDLARLDSGAIRQVQREAWPLVRSADELHDALLSLVALPAEEGDEWHAHFAALTAAGRAAVARTPRGDEFWVATEMWPVAQVLWEGVVAVPPVEAPADVRRDWPRDEAVKIAVRGRLEASGPVLGSAIAKDLALPMGDVRDALLALEADGFAMRGQFTQDAGAPVAVSSMAPRDEESLEWCERRLLSRIHRLTLDGLRRQIQPVPPAAFMRFLARFQHLDPSTRLRGEAGLHELIAQLEGFEAPAADWERHILASRMERYDPAWLDALSYSGRAMWCRLRPRRSAVGAGRPMKAMTRALPITILEREDLTWLLPKDSNAASAGGAAGAGESAAGTRGRASGDATRSGAAATPTVAEGPTGRPLGANARAVLEALERRGALFGAELAADVSLLPRQLEDALGELAAAGLVTSDGYAALRALAGAHATDPRARGAMSSARLLRRRFGRSASSSRTLAGGGRWSLLRRAAPSGAPVDPAQRIDAWCELLLRRYGVIFRDLLAREPAAPAWGALVRAYRRMEARGEVRGGRFVSDVAGEQYALPEAIAQLRAAADGAGTSATTSRNAWPGTTARIAAHDASSFRREGSTAATGPVAASDLLVIAATDPLNLFGRGVPGQKVPALAGHRLAIRGGELMAFARGRDVHVVAEAAPANDRAELTRALGRAS